MTTITENNQKIYYEIDYVKIIYAFFAVLFGVLLIVLLYVPNDIISESSPQLIRNVTNYTRECRNMSIIETAYCFHDFIKGIYNYTVSEDTDRTLEDIIKYGGDCRDYNSLYETMANDLGFNGYSFVIDVNKSVAHRIAIISNENGYCLLDQVSEPKCFMYEK